jgi:hypothetical protein
MTECAVCFPADRLSLVGIFTRPEDGGNRRTPAMVFLNAGLIHRVGPNRLYVRLAREAARRGLASLRFDLSGIGDSLPRTDGLPVRAAALRDVQDAFDFLSTSMAISSFILVGLCSGADLAYRVAVADKRVVGVVLIDGLPYRTVRSRANDGLRRVARAVVNGRWRRLLSKNGFVRRNLARLATRQNTATSDHAGATPSSSGRDIPPRVEAASGLREMVTRGVKVLVIYTEMRGYNYRGQFANLFPQVPRGSVQVEYLKGSDHTFDLVASQDCLVRVVDQWVARFRV